MSKEQRSSTNQNEELIIGNKIEGLVDPSDYQIEEFDENFERFY